MSNITIELVEGATEGIVDLPTELEPEDSPQLALLEGLADLFEEVEAAKSAQMDVMDALADIYSMMEGGE